MQFVATVALAAALGFAGTPAQATTGSADNVAIEPMTPIQDVARSPRDSALLHKAGLLRLAIQWCGSGCAGDYLPPDDVPF
jgi:hypothetical protein